MISLIFIDFSIFIKTLFANEWFSHFIYATQVFISELLLCAYLEKKDHFFVRVTLSAVIYSVFASYFATFLVRFVPFVDYAIIFFLSLAVLPFLYKADFWDMLFCAVAAVEIQNLSFSMGALVSMSVNLFPDIAVNPISSCVQVPVYIITTILAYMVCVRQVKGRGYFGVQRMPMIIISLVSAIVIFFVQYDREAFYTTNFYYLIIMFICCDIMALFLLFGMLERSRLREEKAVMDQIMAKEAKQYELSQKSIEIINLKCHDLKHQISALREMTKSEQDSNINEIEKSVMLYDSIAKTGNKALDVILTSKSMICDEQKITLTYIADGEKLNFMESLDVYSMFGNALDNAIESLKNVPKDKRFINFKLSSQGSFVKMHMENYCNEKLLFNCGLPVTTKRDKNYHGFGLKSIKFVAEKYSGVMTTSIREDMFCLDILLPRNETSINILS